MNIEDFRDYCLSFPGSEEKMPFEKFFHGKHTFLAFYVHGRMFCFFDVDKFDECTVKCPPQQIDELKATYRAVGAPYNLSARYWISIRFDGDLPDDALKKLIRQSYDIVAASLSKRERETLNDIP